MFNVWLILLVAIAAQTFATSLVNVSEGLTRLLPPLGIIVGYGVSFYGLPQIVKVMNLGVAYVIHQGALSGFANSDH